MSYTQELPDLYYAAATAYTLAKTDNYHFGIHLADAFIAGVRTEKVTAAMAADTEEDEPDFSLNAREKLSQLEIEYLDHYEPWSHPEKRETVTKELLEYRPERMEDYINYLRVHYPAKAES